MALSECITITLLQAQSAMGRRQVCGTWRIRRQSLWERERQMQPLQARLRPVPRLGDRHALEVSLRLLSKEKKSSRTITIRQARLAARPIVRTLLCDREGRVAGNAPRAPLPPAFFAAILRIGVGLYADLTYQNRSRTLSSTTRFPKC